MPASSPRSSTAARRASPTARDAGGRTCRRSSPPIYGEYPAKRHNVDRGEGRQHWLDGLSLQPRYRLAAGWGAEIVRQNQDEFMQAAWEQLGDVLAAERAFSLARLARDVLKRVEVRHLAKLSPDRVLAVMSPARARIAIAAGASRCTAAWPARHCRRSCSMARCAASRARAARPSRWRAGASASSALAPVTAQMGALVDNFANASTRLAAIDPNRFVPDGILGSRSYDSVPLPGDLDAVVDLLPYTGLARHDDGRRDPRRFSRRSARPRAGGRDDEEEGAAMGDVWHHGLLTETHAIRVAELQRLRRRRSRRHRPA